LFNRYPNPELLIAPASSVSSWMPGVEQQDCFFHLRLASCAVAVSAHHHHVMQTQDEKCQYPFNDELADFVALAFLKSADLRFARQTFAVQTFASQRLL
jgi:hypothetical protein